MKIKVSFCNKTVLKTDITRYAPLWSSYTLVLAVAVLMFLSRPGATPDETSGRMVDMFGRRANQMVAANGIYAMLVVQALWGDLLTPRLCNSLHAMPVTRDGFFGAHLTAGLLFGLIPNALVFLPAALLVGAPAAAASLMTMAAADLQYIFYLGAALVAVQLAGNRVGMVLIYGILNFAMVLVYWFCAKVFTPLIYGMESEMAWVAKSCPTVAMYQGSYFSALSYSDSFPPYTYHFQGIEAGDAWGKTGVCAGIGVVCMGISQMLYRKRKLESAGDLVAYEILSPVFLTLYTLSVAGLLHLAVKQLASGSVSEYFFLPLGLLVGYITGLMLLRRTSRIFRKRLLIPLAGILGVCFLTLVFIYTDVFGIIRYVPEAEDVESISILPLSGNSNMETGLCLTEKGDIQAVIDYHQAELTDWQGQVENALRQTSDCWRPGSYYNVRLEYRLNSGRRIVRRYALHRTNAAFGEFRMILSRPELTFGMPAEELRKGLNQTVQICYYNYSENGQRYYDSSDGLADAMLKDCAEGTMLNFSFQEGQMETLDNTSGNLDVYQDKGGFYFWTRVFSDCRHTLKWLNSNPYTNSNH